MSAVEALVDHTNTAAENWLLIALGGIIVGVIVALAGAANEYGRWWHERTTAKADHDALVARKTRTWCERWYDGKAADVAALEAFLARGEQRVVLHALRRRPENTTRLTDHRRKHGRGAA